MIVESDVTFGNQLEGRVAALGYDVVATSRTEDEALDVAAEVVPDVVLLNMTPGADVRTVIASAFARWKIPTVFMIVEADEAAMALQETETPIAFVVKPVAERELRLGIELALSRHDAGRAVQEMEDRFFDNSIDMLCHLDFSGYFKRLNPAWERTLGFTRAELMSKPFIEFVHPDDRERTLAQNASVRGGGKALSFENRYLCKDGSYRWFRWNAAPDSPAKVIHSVARDVTESKRAEGEREQLVRELQEALAEVRTLQEILPICSYCRKIRDDGNYWHTVENYVARHTNSRFSHSICPSCMVTEIDAQLEALDRT
jgi:PAS domain S-box-containing protein